MDIIRARLFPDLQSSHYYPDMAKSRRCKQDIVPMRARRRLFMDAQSNMDPKLATTDVVANTYTDSRFPKLEDKYTDIEPFANAPKPYYDCIPTEHMMNSSYEILERISRSPRRVQPARTQSRIEDHFKSKKRKITVPVHKSPEDARISKKAKITKDMRSPEGE